MNYNKKTKILLLLILSVTMVFLVNFIEFEIDSNNFSINKYTKLTSSGYENPIEINGTATGVGANNWSWAKDQPWCTGSGTESDPYIIEDVIIDSEDTGSCIAIYNSEDYFIIKNCTVYNSGSDFWDAGIRLENVTNGKMINNNCSNNHVGIYLKESSFNSILNNFAFNNSYYGIYLVDTARNNIISENILNNNTYTGLVLYALSSMENCKDNTISRNLISNNEQKGILMTESDNNTITENTISNNQVIGLHLQFCDINTIYKNYFINNTLHAQDDSDPEFPEFDESYWDNSVIGNYWDNYTGSDSDDDGIGDGSYTYIPGAYLSPNDTLPIYGDPFHDGGKIHIDGSGVSGKDWAWSSTRAWCSGSGTSDDLYIISDLIIDGANAGSCILIGNSSDYFKIENCTCSNPGIDVSDACIELENADNGIISQNNFSYCDYGMYLVSSDSHTINNNTITYNIECIKEISCTGNTIENNTCTQPVTWDEIPEDQVIEYNTNFQYDLNASSAAGIDHWNINNTDFNIDSNGIITNNTILSVGVHWLRVEAVDTNNYYCVAIFNVTVLDPGPPIWDPEPNDMFHEYGYDFNYDLNATDISGIDYYWLNDTTYFNLDSDTGVITNKGLLALGVYNLEARAYDPYGYYCSANFSITVQDTVSPIITNVDSTKSDGAYTVGEDINIRITFSEPVYVTGTPQLKLETGSSDADIFYTSGTGTNTLIFSYTVGTGENSADLEYHSTNALTGGVINDTVGNLADRTLPVLGGSGSLSYNNDLIIDTTDPEAPIGLSADPTSWTNIDSFDLSWTNPSDLSGIVGARYTLDSAPTSDTDGTYVPGGTSISGIAVSTSGSHTVYVWLVDAAGNIDYTNSATTTLYLDQEDPAAPIGLSADPASWTNIDSFDLSWTNPSDLSGIAGVYYSIDSIPTSGTDGTKIDGTDIESILDLSVGSDGIHTVYLWLIDEAGNANHINRNSVMLYLDILNPTVTMVNSTKEDGTYGVGEIINITITFSEAVYVTGTPQLTLETGTIDAVIDYTNGNETSVLVFSYTVILGDSTSDLEYQNTNALALNGGTIKDVVNNDADRTLPSLGGPGSLSYNKDIVIDTTFPVILNVNSTKPDGTYGIAEIIIITITLSEPVYVSGTPQLILETGTLDAIVDYTTGNGTDTLNFTYTVSSGQISSDLAYASTNALSLNGGTIKDLAGNDADRTLPAPGTSGSLSDNKEILIEAIAPTITDVSSTNIDGTYSEGEIINITITFSEIIYVSGTPQLTLETGNIDAVVNYVSGSGTDTLIFSYTVASGHNTNDLDYISTNALSLNGGTIIDLVGNDGILTLPAPGTVGSLGFNKNLIIETTVSEIPEIFGWVLVGGMGSAIGLSIIIYAFINKRRRSKRYNY